MGYLVGAVARAAYFEGVAAATSVALSMVARLDAAGLVLDGLSDLWGETPASLELYSDLWGEVPAGLEYSDA